MSRPDEALLRIYLSAMPLGKYHSKDSHPYDLCRDGKRVAHIDSADSGRVQEGLVAALVHLLNTREQTEITNAVSNAEFAATLGRVLNRPAAVPLPGDLARFLLGQMADELLLTGCRAVPSKLQAAGFPFLYADLEKTLRHELGRPAHEMDKEPA